MDEEMNWKEKYQALKQVTSWRPKFTFGLVIFSASVAVLEGIGLGFIHPIIEVAQNGPPENPGTVMNVFLTIYGFLGIPFSLGYLIAGVSLIMIFRYSMTFLADWLKIILSRRYEKNLRDRAFKAALNGEIAYFEEEGSDNILNAIITETRYSGKVIGKGVGAMEMVFLVLMYLTIMLYISPQLTLIAIVVLGGITFLLRYIIEPAVTVGKRVAKANENVQQKVQAGTQGIKEVKLFGMIDRVYSEFKEDLESYTASEIKLNRNEKAVNNFYKMSASTTLFIIIYIGFTFTDLELGALGIFLIAMFQLAPRVSSLNSQVYILEGHISHLVRTQKFLENLERRRETQEGEPINQLKNLEFRDIEFSYEEEKILKNISFSASKDDFIAFVGKSGAGKSTIVSLISRMYDPDNGKIIGNNKEVQSYSLEEWRSRIAVVRQKPFIFDDTLEENIKIGNPEASREEIEQVCKASKVDEFMDDLPEGLNSKLGDDGVRLSGGQRQRVALARALLKDADFLILDEATSDLDSNLEKKVQASIESMETDYGIIAIAHRLSTVKNADRIHTLEEGEIIESGTHQELLEKDGKYAQLHKIQSKKTGKLE